MKHTTYIGRSPHEAFFTPDGKEVWVTVRGEDYISVLDPVTYQEKMQLKTPGGPGMTTFSPDGKYGYVCSSFNPELVVFDVASHAIVGKVAQPSPFCPNIAATADGRQVWFTLKDVGKTVAFNAKPPFNILKVLDTGPITNHVNFVHSPRGTFAYVSIGGLNEIKVFDTQDFSLVATIPVGKLPHGVWPSGDGSRIYVGIENGDELTAIDTRTNKVVGSVPVGQAPQAIAYVPNAVPSGSGSANLQPLGQAGKAVHLTMAPPGSSLASTSVSLFDQGLIQIVQASVTGLEPKRAYVLALAGKADVSGPLQPLANFMTNPAGSAIVNATGPVRQVVEGEQDQVRRYLVVAEAANGRPGAVVQVQQQQR